ncbi:hypothetical protein LINGRAHAP2_LOCUS5422 [Linum grandiflorum]
MASFTFSLRILLISTGVLSGALLLKASVPLVQDFSVHQAPVLWSSISSWLRPPYLYVIINCIIITIAASSRFHHGRTEEEHPPKADAVVVPLPPMLPIPPPEAADRFDFDDQVTVFSPAPVVVESRDFGGVELAATADSVFVDKAVTESSVGGSGGEVFDRDDDGEEEEEFVISRSAWIPPKKKRIDSSENLMKELLSPAEKPLVSARFGHRKPVRVSPEGGRKLKVSSKAKRHDTLENTWKMITEGRPMPLNRHLKKSDTWENHHSRQIDVDDVSLLVNASPLPPPPVKKSETFKDRTNIQPVTPATTKLKKEPSLSQEELNRRVEAFINKFNEEMRMQRQESINRYKEMVSR